MVLGELPFLMGVSAEDEGKAAAFVQNALVLACWLVERFILTGQPLPLVQSCSCALVWLAATLIDWAGPTPYDDVTLGLASQVAGCDGGYRSPFILYATVWITGLIFGTLLLCLEEGAHFLADEGSEEEAPEAKAPPLRRKALPIVYGLATSMSCILFATGSATNDMMWVVSGVLLLVISVLCTWNWLWRLEMNLATWGALFHGFAIALRAVQNHAVFRDLRWDPEDQHGLLVVYEFPGLQLFMFGMLVMFVSLQFYLYTCHWKEWRSIESQDVSTGSYSYNVVNGGHARYDKGGNKSHVCAGSQWWQWILLPLCILCQIIGVHVPLIYTECTLPNVTWFHEDSEGYRVSQGESYMDVIRWLYQRQLPCSAFVAAYNAMLLPPLQFLMIFLILLNPEFIPLDLRQSMQTYVMTLAPMRFTQPSIMMLVVGIASLPIENQHPDNIRYGGYFTNGYWFFLSYCVANLILAWSVQPANVLPEPDGLLNSCKSIKGRDRSLKPHFSGYVYEAELSEESGAEDSQPKPPAVILMMAAGVVAAGIWIALMHPYLEFEFRIAGVAIHRVTPTVLDLWWSIGSVNRFLMCFSAVTVIVLPSLWIVLLCARLLAGSSLGSAEPWLRPWVMCHIWAASLVLVYYIVMARNQNTMEVCAKIPSMPLGPAAILCMGLGTYALLHMAKAKPGPSSLPPGGAPFWLGGPALTMLAIGLFFSTHGPVRHSKPKDVEDLNRHLDSMVVLLNQHLHKDVTQTFGDCSALWNHRVEQGEVPASSHWAESADCSGTTPLLQRETEVGTVASKHRMKLKAVWAKGVNSLELESLHLQRPPDLSQAVQLWHLDIRAAFADLQVFINVFVDDKEWYSGNVCCNEPFHFQLQVSVQCRQGLGFDGLELNLLDMDQVVLAHNAALLSGPAWAAAASEAGRRELVKKVVEEFVSLHTGRLLLRNLNNKSAKARQIGSDVLSDIVHLNTGEICAQHV
ncbi:unnamed protein product [Symbiodinium natans]|uniref:Uncharacterized protein n=1 Tax=Symbiodinium natans TaxID=878477 RepID=A0A812JQM7_9DINO|nr:unnamed protein product [Symbiodinium natans]